ncbi:MAG: DUF1236 domain-containing protein [Xanthobacteraceae bacterium]|jgi:hypothetical protein|nr:DUF1236 domain-containing protein [Xanthobacteraceae bacterium]
MRKRFAFLPPVFALLLSAAGVQAQSTGATAPPSTATTVAPKISAEQENRIRDSVKNAKVDHVAKLAIPLTVGAEVPRNLHFYPMPKEVAEIAPEYGGYFYVVAAEKIVVIDPLSYRIVAILPV